MKGPMTTQTLRGMSTHGAMHWRGDRADGAFGTDPCTEPGYAEANSTNAPCDEDRAFRNFIVAFEGLLGKEGTISAPEMQQFADFMLQVQLPPNPVRSLDDSLRNQAAPLGSEQRGSDRWFSCGPGTTECAQLDPNATDTVEDCDGCHSLDPLNGFYGTGGEESFEAQTQHMKVPHVRNMVHKVGMFSVAGPQVRGTGFLHDGSVDTLDTFLQSGVFNLSPQDERDLEAFMLASPTDISPITGQQVTIGPDTFGVADVNARVSLIDAMAGTAFESAVLGGAVTQCDVVVKTVESGVEKGWTSAAGGTYTPDDGGPAIAEATLRAKANPLGDALQLTYTAVPPGAGQRMGIDRDLDAVLNGLDNCPGAPNGAGGGTCTAGDAGLLGTACSTNAACGAGGFCSMAQEDADGDSIGDACEATLVPEPGFYPLLAAGIGLLAGAARLRRRC